MSNYPYTHDAVDTDHSGRHPVNVGHLVMGVAFVGLATIWLLFETKVVLTDDLRWFMPLPWVAAGLAGLLAVALTGRRSKPEVETAYVAAPAYAEPLWAQDPGAADLDARLEADIEAAAKQRAERETPEV